LFFAGSLKDAGAASVTACVPYLCYARKDRRTKPQDPVTTRYVAALFEAIGIDEVIVLDVHNEAAFDNAFRCKSVRMESSAVFAETLEAVCDKSRCVVASPDIGGIKRAQLLREDLAARFKTEVGFAFMEKRRSAGVVSGDTLVGDVADCDVVIHDDMIVSGGTIARAVRAARNAHARRIIVAATHAAFTAEAAQLFVPDGPDLVLVSDSIELSAHFAALPDDRLRICSIAPALAEQLRHRVGRRCCTRNSPSLMRPLP
jgi:ribose-phosphate pyrophosphokinase